MSPRATPRTPFRALRRGLLLLLALLVAGIGGLYLLGRPETPVEDRGSGAGARRSPAGDAIAWSEGFEFEQRVADRSAFRLRGDRFATDREGITRLEGVELELMREGEPYRVRSRRATWDPSEREARLAGEVRLEGGEGLWLEAPRLDLLEDARYLVSRDPVRFGSAQGIGGRADRLRFDFEDDRLLLRGRVRASRDGSGGDRPFALDCEELDYARAARSLAARGEVELVSGTDRLRARQIEVELDAEGERARRAVARGQVAGGFEPGSGEAGAEDASSTTRGERSDPPEADPERADPEDPDAELGPGSGRVRFRSDLARVELGAADGGISALELEGGEGGPARVALRAAGEAPRNLRADLVAVTLEEGRPRAATARGGVELRERVVTSKGGRGFRTSSSERAAAAFTPDGRLAQLNLDGGVQLAEPGMEASGASAEIDALAGSGILRGGGGLARAKSERGELRAPEIRFARDGGRMRAEGGVHATLAAGGEGAIDLGPRDAGDGGEPIRVESAAAEWDDGERSWRFRGDVRAAQGDRLLFADELAGSERSGETIARGGVRTLWKQAPEPGREPVQTAISARQVTYRDAPGVVEYEGEVRVRQQGRELEGERVVVELDAERRARRMTASGAVRLVDRASGRTVAGSRAVHDLEAREILVEGGPVILREADGSTLRGPRLLYDVASGNARMIGSEGAP